MYHVKFATNKNLEERTKDRDNQKKIRTGRPKSTKIHTDARKKKNGRMREWTHILRALLDHECLISMMLALVTCMTKRGSWDSEAKSKEAWQLTARPCGNIHSGEEEACSQNSDHGKLAMKKPRNHDEMRAHGLKTHQCPYNHLHI